MNVLELFAGIGGLSLGLQRAGMRIIGHVEIDPFARSILDRHWPEVPSHDDVRTTLDWWGSARRPRVEVLAGGFPCQGHSVAGKRRGVTDGRWGWPAFRQVVQGLEPPIVVIENVPNLTNTGLHIVLKDLAEDGFDAWWNRVPAAALGAPHLRWRLFTIAAHPERVQLRHEPWWGEGEGRSEQAITGHDGATWALADANSEGRRPGSRMGPARAPAVGAGAWPAEPDVGRVADGVPGRVDRLRVLGNAVVPAVGEYVGRLIMSSFTIRRRRPWYESR